MKEKVFDVREETTLLAFLADNYKETSRSKLKQLLARCTYVDGRKVMQFDYRLSPGMRVTVRQDTFTNRVIDNRCQIVYEDSSLIVINKSEGLLSNSPNPNLTTALTLLNDYFVASHQRCSAHIVHRLDRDTSGLMLFAKHKDVAMQLEKNWKETVFERAYVAVVWGELERERGTITSWLTDGPYCVLSSSVDNGGKIAVTHYNVVRSNGRYSLIELRLDTGRRNQIRVQMREEKHPVVHDPLYGFKDDTAPINRLALHAFKLCFVHPSTGKKLFFETPYPNEFIKLLEQPLSSRKRSGQVSDNHSTGKKNSR